MTRDDRPDAAPADPFAVREVRERFPAVHDGATVYLDNASGAQLPATVIDAMHDALLRLQVNKGGAYGPSREVTAAKERVRARTADFLGVTGDDDGVAFGANATTLLFLLAEAVGDTLEPGDEVVITGLDHHANRDPWRRLARRGVRIREWAPRGPHAELELEDLEPLLGDATRVVAVTGASNLLGTYAPLERIGARLADERARLVVDAVHLAPHRLPDVRAWRADAVAFSPYKVFAPHLGALWICAEWRAELPDWGLSFLPPGPLRWEPGTQNHEAIVAFGAALDHLAWLGRRAGAAADAPERHAWAAGYAAAEAHEHALLTTLLRGLDELGATRYGLPGPDGRTATVAFTMPGRAPLEVAEALGARGVAVAAGHAYAETLAVRHLGLADGAVRASLLHYSDAADVAALLDGVAASARA
jgi:cysteine desulfurase family protein (TIGR01976 family)